MQARNAVRQTLHHWQYDPDLTGLRDIARPLEFLPHRGADQIFTPGMVGRMEEDLKFGPLRPRDDFKRWVNGLGRGKTMEASHRQPREAGFDSDQSPVVRAHPPGMGHPCTESHSRDVTSRSSDVRGAAARAPLPLVLGITGHRDPRREDREAIEDRVRAIFEELRSQYPSTPLVLLSPLAEGADRLAARVALACGVRLIVPLPMPQAVYEQDFQTPASLAEFRELLQRADRHFELPSVGADAAGKPGMNGGARDLAYALGGAYIARNCQILIALWDGEDSGKEGGTAQVIRFKREGIPEDYARFVSGSCAEPGAQVSRLMEPVELGLVYHVMTPRAESAAALPDNSAPYCPLVPPDVRNEDAVLESYNRILKHIDTFNRDWIVRAAALATKRGAVKTTLLPQEGEGFLHPPLVSIRERFAIADALALYYKPRVINSLKLLFLLVFLAALAFDLFAHVDDLRHPPAMLLAYLILLGVAYAWYWRVTRQGDFQNKFQDYRALAEGLRVQFYWRLAGLGDCVEDHYLSLQRGDLDWIRIALRNWGLLDGRSEAQDDVVASPGPYDSMPFVLEHWIKSQRRFFKEAIPRDRVLRERHEWLVTILMGVGLALAVVALRFLTFLEGTIWHGLFLVAAGMAPVGAALIHGYIEKRAFSEHLKRYGRMSMLFDRACCRLDDLLRVEDHAAARQLVRELGREALAENGDWVLLHRQRPLEVPKAG